MIDYRVKTFLTLYETMNYHMTAEKLNMTQPAVTQHIQLLEHEYGCKFFIYNHRKLVRTAEAVKFSVYCRGLLYNEERFRSELSQTEQIVLRIGATKTIGEFVMTEAIKKYLSDPNHALDFCVDNTTQLLKRLEKGELDFALVEGNFEKTLYGTKLFRNEQFVGICSKEHPFAGREVSFDELFCNTIILREEGSGTRSVLEQILADFGYGITDFKRKVYISNFSVISKLVSDNIGISFVYKVVSDTNKSLATFNIKDIPMIREFNYVYLKNTNAVSLIEDFALM